MLFSSIVFLYFFLPAVLICYFLAPKSWKNAVLLLASLIFYAWGEPKYVFLMLGEAVFGYLMGLGIGRCPGTAKAKLMLLLALLFDLGALFYFKYTDFFIENFVALTGAEAKLLHLALPIGISFYTFQILSYNIDVYRGTVAAQRNPVTLAAYVTLFPQLIAGPIVRYRDVERELMDREQTMEGVALGVKRFLLGLAKKVLVANGMGAVGAAFLASKDWSVLYCWLYAAAYTLQVYFDFSGYSDMAIGLGKMFGFSFPENFAHPYISGSITEFWRRWHISLGSWFRDYVYIPLGGNRTTKGKWIRNIFIVWFLTGFWHGASWNFILWGLFFAVLLLIEKLFIGEWLSGRKVFCHVYVMLLVVVSFVIFGADNLPAAGKQLAGMFGAAGLPLCSAEGLYYLKSYFVLLAAAILGATPLPAKAAAALGKKCPAGLWTAVETVYFVALFLVVTAYLVDGSFNPFLYFRF